MAKRDVSSDLAENAKVAYPQSSDVRFVIFDKDRDIPMLELKNRPYIVGASTQPADDEARELADSARLFLIRHYKAAILLMVLGVIAGVAYLKFARPSYTATVIIELSNREGQFLRQQATLTDLPADAGRAIQFTKSATLADYVVRKLRLDKDPEFDRPASDLLTTLWRPWHGGSIDPKILQLRAAVSSLLGRTRVVADPSGGSFTIAFTSYNPEKSADIANAIADAFISFQGEADAQLHKQAADWLVGQSNELAGRSQEAAKVVSDFIKKNNIIVIDGKPLDQQNLENVNKRVVEAKSKLLDAQYKLNKINASIKDVANHNILDATAAAEILLDPSIAKARERYADLTTQLQALTREYGKGSQKLQDTLTTTEAAIVTELSRLQENARDDHQRADKNYEELLAEQKTAAEASQHANYLDSQLKELQGTEKNYRTLYESFLQHSAEAARELSFPARDAHISERAETPLDKSWPKPLIVLAGTTLGGLALGLGVGALRDLTDGVFRTVDQFESVTQLKCLGLVPATTSRIPRRNFALAPEFAVRFKSPQRLPLWTKIKTAPNSRFVSELIAVRLALRSSESLHGGRVFGVTSALAGEGKSSLVASLGVLMAQSGNRVAVVDLDFRNPTLTELFAPNACVGLSHVLLGHCALEEVLVRDPTLNLAIVPGGASVNIMQAVELLASAKMRECIVKLQQNYEIVLIDLPPLLPITDVRATAEFIDNYILIVEWAKTPTALVRRAIGASPEITDKLAMGILNKVNFKVLSKYDPLATSYYLRPEFSRYLDHE